MSSHAMGPVAPAVRILDADGVVQRNAATEEYLPVIEALDDAALRRFHRDMVVTRRFDEEAGNLQRQGQLALWVPSHGQEAAQVGSAHATRDQDHLFPSYREHAVGTVKGIDPLDVIRLLRGVTHGGWDPAAHKNFHLYTLVIGSQTLHATGYAMGIALDGDHATGDPTRDEAVITYFGDGFGIPSTQIDGNDVLASYAVTRRDMDAARAGKGPRFIEALTYRVGAHTTSDDPTKYRTDDELASWVARDPIVRFERYLRGRGESDAFFAEVEEEALALADDVRRRTLALQTPSTDLMFDHVYSEPHPRIDEQREWLAAYEASFGGSA